MPVLFLATGNAGKARELEPLVRPLLARLGWPDASISARAAQQAEETGETYAENASIKADALVSELRAEGSGEFAVLADDSGLSVEALNGRPGVRSARYAGVGATSQQHIDKLLSELEGHANRAAAFVCHLVLVVARGSRMLRFDAEGRCEGRIVALPRGQGGFGYDPIFEIPSQSLTMAELPSAEKNRISHRARAFEELMRAVESHG